MFQKKCGPSAKKHGNGAKENQRFYEYIAAPLSVWQWNKTVSPEMNKLAMRDLLAAVGRAKELLPCAKCESVRDGGSWDANGRYFQHMRANSRLKQVEDGLRKNRWDWACHEFHDVLFYNAASDKGILFRLIQIVENHIWENRNQEAKTQRTSKERS